ncbi:trypsin-1-like [Aphidius gifuensis]|uniref:trypsin-1-like n=1 Tax=Aphidius gifuensis TaxID=684658 RepID=UPI001CDD39A8|nr:trypsin-1-like [Aphidius gifuensis]
MKIFFLLSGLLALTQGGLIPSPLGSTKIINGVDSKPGEIPYQVSLQMIGNSFHFCGGSVLNQKYVITAAHCVVGQNALSIKVVAGTTDLSNPISTHYVKKIIIHKKYNPNDSWRNDIALLLVQDKFLLTSILAFVPLTKPKEIIPANSVAVVSGWGSTVEGGQSPMKLKKAEILIADQAYCQDRYKSLGENIYSSSHICAHDPVQMTGSCHGDSGGPLTVNGKLVGLVSWALGCANTEYPTVYTRVPEFHDWIKSNAI